MKNTEKFVVFQVTENLYINRQCAFIGTKEQAEQYAAEHNYCGGITTYDHRKKTAKLTFVCPECGSNKLGQESNDICTTPVTDIPFDGNLEYDYANKITHDGETAGHCCMDCGFELTDEDGQVIEDIVQVPIWIFKNCR